MQNLLKYFYTTLHSIFRPLATSTLSNSDLNSLSWTLSRSTIHNYLITQSTWWRYLSDPGTLNQHFITLQNVTIWVNYSTECEYSSGPQDSLNALHDMYIRCSLINISILYRHKHENGVLLVRRRRLAPSTWYEQYTQYIDTLHGMQVGYY